jgi:hypothetical protein
MQALIQNNAVAAYPYSFVQLKRDNSQTSFPSSPSSELLESYGVYEVAQSDQPTYNQATHRIEEGTPASIEGVWTQVWNVIELTAEEIAQKQADHATQVEAQRAKAYRTESDPLFFKSQRGEATHQEWLDKVAEIKARYSVEGS